MRSTAILLAIGLVVALLAVRQAAPAHAGGAAGVELSVPVVVTEGMTKAQLVDQIRKAARGVALQRGVPVADADWHEVAIRAADVLAGRSGGSARACTRTGSICLNIHASGGQQLPGLGQNEKWIRGSGGSW